MLFAPPEGWRRVEVSQRRIKVDWAPVVRKLVDDDHADRERILLVMDNSHTHQLAGKPTDNAFIEAPNGSFRQKCLNENWFLSLAVVAQKVESW